MTNPHKVRTAEQVTRDIINAFEGLGLGSAIEVARIIRETIARAALSQQPKRK